MKTVKDIVIILTLCMSGYFMYCGAEYFTLHQSMQVRTMQSNLQQSQRQYEIARTKIQDVIRQLQEKGDDKTKALIDEIINKK